MSAAEVASLSLEETLEALAAHELSAAALTEDLIDRIARFDPEIGAVTEILRDTARPEAAAADALRRRPGAPSFAGVPVLVKDIIDTVPAVCSAGLPFLRDSRPTADAEVVRRLRAAGAVVLGVTATDPGAFGVQTPAVRHPQSPELSVGGSSGGSGAALAAGFAPAALGTDTGGSIHIPAACCAVVGLKPTRGRVPTTGVRPLVRSLDHVGPMTRRASDLPSIQRVLDPDYERTRSAAAERPTVVGRDPRWEEEADPEIRAGVADALAAARALGAELREIRLPDPEQVLKVHGTIFCTEAAAYHLSAFGDRLNEYPDTPRKLIEWGRKTSGIDHVRACDARAAFAHTLQGLFAELDLLILPTCPVLTPPRQAARIRVAGRDADFTLGMVRYTALFDHTGHPAVAMPAKLYAPGRAASIQVVAARGHDADAVDFAIRLESALGRTPDYALRV
jgi:Asp-tRNA(Asn)/Glu-tRNA(Gln) amidotransferase A subunit family amidase